MPEGIIFQSQNAYKQLRKMLVEDYLVAVISLPAGVFNPYSGVKTSILLLDKSLAKQTDDILFVKKLKQMGSTRAQRKEIKQNDLPRAREPRRLQVFTFWSARVPREQSPWFRCWSETISLKTVSST